MGRYGVVKGGKSESGEADSEHRGFGCVAHGCPLPGVFSDSTTGGGDWRCWAHDRAEDSSQWPFLTQGIKLNGWLFRLADKVAAAAPYDLERNALSIECYLAQKGRADLSRQKNTGEWPETLTHEPRSYWVQRLRGAAFKAAMAYVDEHWMSPAVRRQKALMAEFAGA
jgi:hypothetical protein